VLGALDHATSGAGADIFAFGEWGASGPAMIHDYDPAEDELVLVYDPALHPDPLLSIEPGGEDGSVYLSLDGTRLAEVANGEGLSPEDVTLRALNNPQAA
ncbi:MAG: hypothetical protein PF443_08630, partial [Allgaiera sp.]|nr:hypothetical protein [Allgaiera sp.]